MIAANAEIGVARAAYFPQLSLSGFLGGQSTQLASLFSGAHTALSLAPQLAQPIFTAGRLKSDVRLTEAQREEALVQYEKTIQTAFAEVSNSLIAHQRTRESRAKQEDLVYALQDRLRLAYIRYRGGVDTQLDALDADRDLFPAELSLSQIRLQEVLTVVQLYKALRRRLAVNEIVLGIHHITAIAGDPQQNIDFYTGVLGLRLVKVTVNFDDPEAYHFYYGDGHGRPGTILTFFSWPGAGRGRRGNGQVTAASFAVPRNRCLSGPQRLSANGIASEKQPERFGHPVLSFSDPDGLRWNWWRRRGMDASHVWKGSEVPRGICCPRLHGATLSETGFEQTAELLTETMGFRLTGPEHNRFRYEPTHSHLSTARPHH